MGWESSDLVRLPLGLLIQGLMRRNKFKHAYNLLIIRPRVIGILEIMGLESFDVVRINIWPLL